jgi:pimeloyl-ACP methyl ester carboxylesterase
MTRATHREHARRPVAARCATDIHVHRGIAVWESGSSKAPFDIWFHPAFGDSALSYRHILQSTLSRQARVFVYDPPGHGASSPRVRGLTIAAAARLWSELIARFSGSRPVVLVGHSMAGIIASETAARLERQPVLVIGVEANLTPEDAYFTGLAARFDKAAAFYASFRRQIRLMARRDDIVHRFACSLEFADPVTLFRLGRSVAARKDPGVAFRRLRCPKIHYWDSTASSQATRVYLAGYQLPHRKLDRLGHWPMIKAAEVFCAAVASDIRQLMPEVGV